jgi:hypothetical protein
MARAHVFIVRYVDNYSNPHLKLVIAEDRDAAEKILLSTEQRSFIQGYCGDVDPTSISEVTETKSLDGLNIAAALRFASLEYRDILGPRDPAHLKRMAALISEESFDRIIDGSVDFTTKYGRPPKRK